MFRLIAGVFAKLLDRALDVPLDMNDRELLQRGGSYSAAGTGQVFPSVQAGNPANEGHHTY